MLYAALAVAGLVVVALAVLGASGVMTTRQRASGLVIGLAIAGLGNHLPLFGLRS